jgi:hypothetical protein
VAIHIQPRKEGAGVFPLPWFCSVFFTKRLFHYKYHRNFIFEIRSFNKFSARGQAFWSKSDFFFRNMIFSSKSELFSSNFFLQNRIFFQGNQIFSSKFFLQNFFFRTHSDFFFKIFQKIGFQISSYGEIYNGIKLG